MLAAAFGLGLLDKAIPYSSCTSFGSAQGSTTVTIIPYSQSSW